LDGYPDLLLVTNQRALLLESVLCNNKLCTQADTNNYRRSFKLVSQGAEALSKDISNPRQAAFFDIAEDVSPNFYHGFNRAHSIYLYCKLKGQVPLWPEMLNL
jgi:uncharacterized protein YfaT (DUF1175 family)